MMEYFILAKKNELAAIPADRKLFDTYKGLGYRFIEKTRSCDQHAALKLARRKYGSHHKVKLMVGLSLIFFAYWAYFYALLT